MAFRTFLGPLLIGTQKWGAGRNTGVVQLVQSYNSPDLTNTVVGNVDTAAMVLPRGAQIIDIMVDQTVAAGGTGTTTVSVGTTSGGAELMAAVATTSGGRFRGTTTAATQAAWFLSTTADTTVYVRVAVGIATLTAGKFSVIIEYAMREADGSYYPAQG